jgi:uncharacterized protein
MGSTRRQGAGNGQCHPLDAARLIPRSLGIGHLSFCAPSGQYNSMSELREQKAASQREMPTLWRRLLTPKSWLAVGLIAVSLIVADAARPPQKQLSVRIFVSAVADYHAYIHPFTERFVRCRYRPTCSAYAVEAVRRYGIIKGGWMSLRRVASCQQSVPMGTWDPVR